MPGVTERVLSLIDCFSWETVDAKTNKLIYYDNQGKRFERIISKEIMERTLGLFDGKSHLVRRSTGGYSPAHPTEMLVYHTPGQTAHEANQTPIIRVRVRMIDVERDGKQHISGDGLVVQYKSVSPEDIQVTPKDLEPFGLQYLMDFGYGIIPLSVFEFYRDMRELVQACFVRTDEIEAAAKAPRGSKVLIQTYRIPEPVLRLALPNSAQAKQDLKEAKNNLNRLVQAGIDIIPPYFKAGPQMSIPTGSTPDMLLHYLRIAKDPEVHAMSKPLLTILDKPRDEEDSQLLPFGVFERP